MPAAAVADEAHLRRADVQHRLTIEKEHEIVVGAVSLGERPSPHEGQSSSSDLDSRPRHVDQFPSGLPARTRLRPDSGWS